MRILSFILLSVVGNTIFAQTLEQADQNKSLSYPETFEAYRAIARSSDQVSMMEYGITDVGEPLQLCVIASDQTFTPEVIQESGKRVLFINNAIHPGEPCGVDASVRFAQELTDKKGKLNKLLDEVVVCIIPFYNIGGGFNRSCCSRVNQNGPEEYGFRGNAKNLDLNRDFIKCDSKNAREFTRMFRSYRPDIFIDTHTTNGWDYQYHMGLIATQRDKLQQAISNYWFTTALPKIYDRMADAGYEIIPYVYATQREPSTGIKDFYDSPRYSSGYAALFNCMSFITEAHKFKSFDKRVAYTYQFLVEMLKWTSENAETIGLIKKGGDMDISSAPWFNISWEPDTVRFENLRFKGYKAKYRKSELSGLDMMYYDHNDPFDQEIPYFNHYNPTVKVDRPQSYVIPQAWAEVIDRLKLNQVKMRKLKNDTTIKVTAYYIDDYETGERVYEGHYLHYGVKVRPEVQEWNYLRGDYIIDVNQDCNRYVIETLDPRGPDSFFAWNFFDPILQQKEWFSPFAFEATAIEILKEDKELADRFKERKKNDDKFANSHRQQLGFIYKNSRYYEKTAYRYPVTRIEIQ